MESPAASSNADDGSGFDEETDTSDDVNDSVADREPEPRDEADDGSGWEDEELDDDDPPDWSDVEA